MKPRLILASGSPRRRELLGELDLELDIRPADIDETPYPDEPPADYVLRLAEAKARAVLDAGADTVVLAADTIVALDGDLLGKPADEAEARRMLGRLAGRSHHVLTGVAVIRPGNEAHTAVETTRVHFAPMSEREIAWYAATGEPHDRAGAYAIQGRGALFVAAIEGNYSNVVGLPLPASYRLLRAAGLNLQT